VEEQLRDLERRRTEADPDEQPYRTDEPVEARTLR
jgi:hypothetical protein